MTNFKEKSNCKVFKINNKNTITNFTYKFSINGETLFYELIIDFDNNNIIKEKLHNGKIYGIYFDRFFNDEEINISCTKKMSKEDYRFFDVYAKDFKNNQDKNFNTTFFLRDVARKRPNDSEYYKVYKDVYKEIIDTIVIYPETEYGNFFGLINDNEDFTSFKKILSDYNIDITDIIKEEISLDSLLANSKEIQKDLVNLIDNLKKGESVQISLSGILESIKKEENGEIKINKLTLRHGSDDSFEYFEESNGTRRLFDLLPLLLLPKDKRRLVLIDEIDQSLHTLLTQKLIKDLFDKSFTSSSQFLITTHDINLFNQSLLRGDEILLVNKDSQMHSSNITSFVDFKKRADRDVISRYLSGEFGAIPKLS